MLVRADAMSAIDHTPSESRLATLHLIAPMDLDLRRTDETGGTTVAAGEIALAGVEPRCAEAIARLIGRRPSSSRLDDIAAPDADAATRAALPALLLRMARAGLLDVASEPTVCASDLSPRPKAWPLAASDAKAGDLTATLRHAPYHLDVVDRSLLPRLDGRRSRDSLIDLLADEVAAGRLPVSGPGGRVADRRTLRAALSKEIDKRLASYARLGLLVAD